MRVKKYFLLSLAFLISLCSFKLKLNNDSVNLNQQIRDSAVRVTVQFEDSPGGYGDCGIMLVKGSYKFKLIGLSRYLVKSKNDFIRIQYTCPKETAAGLILKKTYHFTITLLHENNVAGEIIRDGIPVYTFK